MQQTRTGCFILLTLCVTLVGCGDAATEQPEGQASPEKQQADPSLAMVLETSELTYGKGNPDEQGHAIDDVALLVGNAPVDRGYTIRIDASHQRAGQLRVLLERDEDNAAEIDLEAEADTLFETLKTAFDREAQEIAYAELADRTRQAAALDAEFQAAQKKLLGFQEAVRSLPNTDEIRLERRKRERKVETSLQAKVEADKLIASLQKRIDRKRFVTLQRVR